MKRETEDKERLEVNVGRSVRIPFCMVSIDFTSWYGRHPFSSSCSVPHVICKCCTSHVLWPEFISLNQTVACLSVTETDFCDL